MPTQVKITQICSQDISANLMQRTATGLSSLMKPAPSSLHSTHLATTDTLWSCHVTRGFPAENGSDPRLLPWNHWICWWCSCVWENWSSKDWLSVMEITWSSRNNWNPKVFTMTRKDLAQIQRKWYQLNHCRCQQMLQICNSFLGIVTYMSLFIPNLADETAPHRVLKKKKKNSQEGIWTHK